MKDVVVLLPGITGSVLRRDRKDVWAFTAGAFVRALVSLGGSVRDLALTDDPADVDDLGDGVTADRVMPDIHMIPGLWKIDGYTKVAKAIRQTFEVEPGRNFFEFPYDWRRDNRVAARKLARKSRDWLTSWREATGNDDARLILIGHSMGGLVSRYFLECLDGWRDTRMLVTFGTPYRGSLNAVRFISEGLSRKLGPLTLIDLSGLLRSFTSVYQLLPIYPCVDAGDGALARVAETDGIPHLDRDRAAAALAFHREIEAAVDEHRRDEQYRDEGYRIHPVVGTFQPTLQSARLDGDGVKVLREYEGSDLDGDGTVPRVSATPIEIEDEAGAMFAAERHGSLQNADPVLVQLAGLMSGIGLDLGSFRDPPGARLGLDLEDAYATGEPITISVRTEDPIAVGELTAVVIDAERGAEVERGTLPRGDEPWRTTELPPLPEGAYRITVGGGGLVRPVTDVFGVFGGAAEG
jgi:pimeloyl-ACP methyl ester carboxylesterase